MCFNCVSALGFVFYDNIHFAADLERMMGVIDNGRCTCQFYDTLSAGNMCIVGCMIKDTCRCYARISARIIEYEEKKKASAAYEEWAKNRIRDLVDYRPCAMCGVDFDVWSTGGIFCSECKPAVERE